jgi:hypothetical protein
MLDIFAFSQSFGRTPVSMKLWDMMASYGASCFAHYFIILFGMLSGPDALDGLIFLSYSLKDILNFGYSNQKNITIVTQSSENAQISKKQFSSEFTRGRIDNIPETHTNLKSTIPSITTKTRSGKTTK